MKVLKIQIHVTQNVGKVWIDRKKTFPAPFGAIPGNFLHGPKKSKNCQKIIYFPWWANGLYSPGLGSCAGVAQLSGLGQMQEQALQACQQVSMVKQAADYQRVVEDQIDGKRLNKMSRFPA